MLNCVGIRDTWLAKSCHWEVVHLPHSDQRSQRHPEIQQIYIHIRIHYILCTCSSINRISGSYLIYARGVRKGAIIGLSWPFWTSWNVFHFSHHPLKITGAFSKDDLLKWLDTAVSCSYCTTAARYSLCSHFSSANIFPSVNIFSTNRKMDLSKAEMFSRELELSDDGDLLVKVDQVLECNMTEPDKPGVLLCNLTH